MPLFAGEETAEPTDDTPGIWSEDVGTMATTWTDPTGVVWHLTDTSDDRGHFTRPEIAGWGAMPYEIITDPNARGGESVRFIRQQPARITWPLHIFGDTHMEFVQRYRALKKAFTMTVHRGLPGTLRVARPDGTAREIDAFYEDGFGGEPGELWLSANPALTLFCPDGAWRDITQIAEERAYSTPTSFLDPFFTVSSSKVLGETEIVNPGDVVAWPDWTITGPCTAVEATNVTTGQTFTLTHTLTAGQQITIVTGGTRQMVRGPGDVNLTGALNWPAAYLWPLLPDVNEVEFVVSGASSGTRIRLAFYPRYEGA